MTFIPVTADQCNSQGIVIQRTVRTSLRLNKELVGAINGQEVYLKGGNILNLSGNFYMNIRLATNVNVDSY